MIGSRTRAVRFDASCTGPAVSCRGLTRLYGPRRAVDGLDLEVERGLRLGIVGANGAGKTTLMRMMSGTMAATSGTLEIFGEDVLAQPRAAKSRLGVVPQGMTLDTELRVAENLRVFGRYRDGLRGRAAHARAAAMLDAVGLMGVEDALVGELSGGMQRRLLIARALIGEPGLLLLDEPTTGLDAEGRDLVWERLDDAARAGATVVVTSHHMDEIERFCDEIILLDKGRLVTRDSPAAILSRTSPRQWRGDGVRLSAAAMLEEALRAARFAADGDVSGAPAGAGDGPRTEALKGTRSRRSIGWPSPRQAGRIWLRNATLFRRSYRTTIVPNFCEPVFLLLAFGLGLGAYIDDSALDGSFTEFIAPGLLAVSAMNGAVFEVTYNIFVRLRHARSYDAVVTTPVEPQDIGLGELAWALTRCLVYSSLFLVVVGLMGHVHTPLALLAPPLLLLLGLVFGAVGILFTSKVTAINAYSYFYTIVLTPLMLVSGVFFPEQRLPEEMVVLQWFNPLNHGVAMARALLDGGPLTVALGHAAWLGIVGLVLAGPAIYSLRRQLIA